MDGLGCSGLMIAEPPPLRRSVVSRLRESVGRCCCKAGELGNPCDLILDVVDLRERGLSIVVRQRSVVVHERGCKRVVSVIPSRRFVSYHSPPHKTVIDLGEFLPVLFL